jgi:hypothetical protein
VKVDYPFGYRADRIIRSINSKPREQVQPFAWVVGHERSIQALLHALEVSGFSFSLDLRASALYSSPKFERVDITDNQHNPLIDLDARAETAVIL